MASYSIVKDVSYLNKDFSSFRNNLIDFAKVYFPETYADFSDASIGMMFIELVSYVGDVLSYNIDATLKETMIQHAEERKNVIALAKTLGYKYRNTIPSTSILDVYQLLPAKGIDGSEIDYSYGMRIKPGMIVSSITNPRIQFRTTEYIDFSVYNDLTSTNDDASVYEVDINGNPTLYLYKKSTPIIAGTLNTYQAVFTTPEKFTKIVLPYDDVIEIIDVVDSDGDVWYEVDYLAQDTVIVDQINDEYINTQFSTERQYVPMILKYKKTAKRFVTSVNEDGNFELQFGAGTSNIPDQLLLPTNKTIGYATNFTTFVDSIQKTILSSTYGISPSNTTLTIRFTRGGGYDSNLPSNDIRTIVTKEFDTNILDFNTQQQQQILRQMRDSLYVVNPIPATGGRGSETINEIKQNSIAFFNSQNRCVTDMDYVVRTMTMPPKYGNVAKAFVNKDSDSPFTINLYTLGYDINKKLTQLSVTGKQNLKTYLSQYKALSASVNIKDAFIINIGVKFKVITYSNANKNEVLVECIRKISDFFNIDLWQIGQPIILRDLYEVLDKINGVRTVSDLQIFNKYDPTEGYSNNYYNIPSATKDGIIYTSADPSIFELKYPTKDIEGR